MVFLNWVDENDWCCGLSIIVVVVFGEFDGFIGFFKRGLDFFVMGDVFWYLLFWLVYVSLWN